MERSKFTRFLAILLAVLMLSASVMTLSAASGTTGTFSTDTIAEALEQLNDLTWPAYLAAHQDAVSYDGEDIVIPARNYSKFYYSTSDSVTEADAAMPFDDKFVVDGVEAVLLPDIGTIEYTVNVPTSGFYQLAWNFFTVSDKSCNVERTLRINGKVPFGEVRNLVMTKTWKSNYELDETQKQKDSKIISYTEGIQRYIDNFIEKNAEAIAASISTLKIDAENVKSIEYFDLSGARVLAPTRGIYAERITLKNGKYEYTKGGHSSANVPLLVYGCENFMENGEVMNNKEASRRVACVMGCDNFPIQTVRPMNDSKQVLDKVC